MSDPSRQHADFGGSITALGRTWTWDWAASGRKAAVTVPVILALAVVGAAALLAGAGWLIAGAV